MPAANDDAYSVQKFLNGYAIVWWEDCGDGPKRRRLRLAATDRESAKAEARKRWEGGDDSPWTVGRCMTGYLASIEGKVSHQRRQDAWKAMKLFWADVDPSMIDKAMCQSYRAKRRVGDATARYELMQLSTALGWAFSARRIERKPAIWLPQTPERKTRPLLPTEIVHHEDRQKQNNAPSNLTITTNSAHSREHMKGNQHARRSRP